MKKIVMSAILMAMTFFVLPSDNSSAVSAQRRGSRTVIVRQDVDRYRDRHRDTWRKKSTYGYKNYGQYRRTRVGNRRYRMVSRPYWVNGTRRVRTVRTYY